MTDVDNASAGLAEPADVSAEVRRPFEKWLCVIGLGVWLAWFWMAFVKGICNPADEGKGYLLVGVPVGFAAAAAMFLAVAWMRRGNANVAHTRGLCYVAGVVGGLCSSLLSTREVTSVSFALDWVLCALVGLSAAIVFLLCVSAYARYDSHDAFFGINLSIIVAFSAYCLVINFTDLLRTVAFGSLLVIVVALSLHGRSCAFFSDDAPRKPARQSEALARRFGSMLAAFAVIVAAMSFGRAFSFSVSAAPGLVGDGASSALALAATAAIVVCVFGYNKKPILHYLKAYYLFAVLGVTFAVAAMSLGVFQAGAVTVIANVAYLMALVVIVCGISSTLAAQGGGAVRYVGVLSAAICLSAGLSWGLQSVMSYYYDLNASLAFLMAFGFLSFSYCVFVFNASSFYEYVTGDEGRSHHDHESAEGEPSASPPAKTTFRDAALKVAADAHFTKREQEVFLLLVKGESSKRISELLVVSYHTVRAHTRNIYAKLGVHGHQEMVDRVIEAREAQLHDSEV